MKFYEDLMICDLAEYYNVFNWRELPIQTVAILVYGLSDDSRVKKAITKQDVSLEQNLLMKMTDQLSILLWQNTKDGHKNRNKPVLLQDLLINKEKEIKGYSTKEEFELAKLNIICG